MINTRQDLDALDKQARADFIALLGGTLYRIERDDLAEETKVVLDETTVARFGLSAKDFPGVKEPIAPKYEAVVKPVPTVVSMRQARLALLGASLLDAVNQGIKGMPQAVQIEWEFATTVDRESPLVQTLAGALKLDAATLDSLFTTAGAL